MKHLFEDMDRTASRVDEINREAEQKERKLFRIAKIVAILAGVVIGCLLTMLLT